MKTSLFKSLYFQVLTAIAIGILLGHFYPEIGEQMKPLGDGFVKLIKHEGGRSYRRSRTALL